MSIFIPTVPADRVANEQHALRGVQRSRRPVRRGTAGRSAASTLAHGGAHHAGAAGSRLHRRPPPLRR